MFLYFIKKGDNLSSISKRFETPTYKIIKDNGLKNPNELSIGDCLIINKDSFTYKSKKNDTFETIAKKYNINVSNLKKDNIEVNEPIKENTNIYINFSEKNKKNIYVNGYSYPSISDNQLDEVLPYLTFISIFSYKVDENGNLNNIDDERVINKAIDYGVAPIFVVSNIKNEGGFSPDLASKILNNSTTINTFLNNILSIIKRKKYYGVNIDFEYVKEEDKEKYENFMKNAYNFFKSNNYYFSTALAPKISGEQKGLLYTAHDYNTAGKNNDLIILMTYEWGYMYSESMPVSPLNKVEDVIKYASTKINNNKILLGIPNYGYDYTLPYEKGSKANTITLDTARKLAYENGAEILYYHSAETPYFKYKKNNKLHEVQFDNAYSFYKKLELIEKYDLKGISIWTIKTYNPTYYTLLSHYFTIEKLM